MGCWKSAFPLATVDYCNLLAYLDTLSMTNAIKKLAQSPELRLFTTSASTILSGVLASAYVADITIEGHLNWSSTWTSQPFHLLLGFVLLWFAMQLVFLDHDRSTSRFADDEHCLAFVRQMQLEGYAAQIKEDPTKAGTMDIPTLIKQLKITRGKK